MTAEQEIQERKQAGLAMSHIASALAELGQPAPQEAVSEIKSTLNQSVGALNSFLQTGTERKFLDESYRLMGVARELLTSVEEEACRKALESVTRGLAVLHPVTTPSEPTPEEKDAAKRRRVMSRQRIESQQEIQVSSGADRRSQTRVFIDTEVSFESDSNFYTGFTEDLSDGGLFVATYNLRPVGTVIEMSFTLADGYVINTQGVVKWVRDLNEGSDALPGVGIEFEQLEDPDKAAIDKFINRRDPIFYDE